MEKSFFVFIFTICLFAAHAQEISDANKKYNSAITGAERISDYLPLLQNQTVGIVANNTSFVGQTHLIDTLLSLKVNITKIFAPEHGFRGDQADGAHIKNYTDSKTGIGVISLYGNSLKPKQEDLQGLDIVIFDIQDVGARFYTYISTMHNMMEACADLNISMMILDRPNPNGFYIDGPVLDTTFRSFVGMHPIPIVHGLTIGELALMINGEKWLGEGRHCGLSIIKCKNYNHKTKYILPIKPSPNLTSMEAVYLYPSLCLFEATIISVGRGTIRPFEIIGHPLIRNTNYSFTPKPIIGMSDNPPLAFQKCYGYDLKEIAKKKMKKNGEISLKWIIKLHKELNDKTKKFFLDKSFDRLAGNSTLRQQIINGKSEDSIKKSWQSDLERYKLLRKKYLLYEDFE